MCVWGDEDMKTGREGREERKRKRARETDRMLLCNGMN